jgi:outer membrane protein assembly factor BamB
VTCGDESTATRTILAVRASDGAVLWRRDEPSQPHPKHKFNSYAAATPAMDARRIYVTWTTPAAVTLLAMDHDGRTAWKKELGPFAAQHGSGTSPIVFERLVILANDTEGESSFVVALDAETGREVWRHPRRTTKASYSTPALLRPPAGPPQLIVTGKDHGITSLDPLTGSKRWELADVFPARVVGSPVVAAGLVIGTCGEGGKGRVLVAARPAPTGGPGGAAVAYTLSRSVPYVPTPVACGDLLILWGDAGIVQCARAATGEILWTERVGGDFFASPLAAGDRIYNISKTGEVVVLAAKESFAVLARNAVGEGSYATPAIAGGRLIVRTFTRLMAVGRR